MSVNVNPIGGNPQRTAQLLHDLVVVGHGGDCYVAKRKRGGLGNSVGEGGQAKMDEDVFRRKTVEIEIRPVCGTELLNRAAVVV